MKHYVKRSLALLLALVLCLSGLQLAPNAAAAQYTANWGQRGMLATELSEAAEAFYSGTNTYDTFMTLTGSATVSQVPESALYEALQDFMTSKHTVITSYDGTRELFRYTDCQDGDSASTGAISSFYSGKAIGPGWDGGDTWNREHTWPNSKGEGDAENDIMMLRPTAVSENSSRGNKAYGESSGYYDPNSVSNNTYDLRGDVARIMLYVYVRWGNTTNMWGTEGVIESREVLLDWMEADPVDTWELGRNDAVQSITGTRNVFVDYPELAFQLFGTQIPADMDTPSGEAVNTASPYTITAVSADETQGTVSVNGRYINAVPAQGYAAAGYELVSGTAAITQNGNVFRVEATSDCTVRILFASLEAATLTYMENGTVTDQESAYQGDVLKLAAPCATPEGMTFLGWSETTVAETEEKPAYLTPGSSYTLQEDTVLYALYSVVDLEGQGQSDLFGAYTGTITEGNYLIVYDGAAMKAADLNGRLDFEAVTPVENTVQNPDDLLIWTVSANGSYYTLFNESTGKYAAGTGVKNKAQITATLNNYAKWSVSGTSAYNFYNLGNQNQGINYTLRRNANYGFACYAEGFNGPVKLYKQMAGSVSYTTGESCAHSFTVDIPAVEATCTQTGCTAGVQCDDCLAILSGCEETPALGHYWGQWQVIKEMTPTADGLQRRACMRCQQIQSKTVARPANVLILTGELAQQTTVWVEGLPVDVQLDGTTAYVLLPAAQACTLVTYTYHAGDGKDIHTQYPTGMKVYQVSKAASGFQAKHIPALDNLLQYSGSSIRITGKKGIRMITSLTKANKTALTGKGLGGYKLLEYGTALCWASELAADGDLVLGKSYTRSNYAYKKGKADPVFATTSTLTQYTNVLVGFTNDQCRDDIAMRPYIILEDSQGQQITLYGGTVYRSIGYIAYQNRNVFKPGTESYNYVWGIIHHVYGDKYDADYKG